MGIHEWLKSFREKAGLTQEQMGEKLHITQSHISKYEKGRKIIDLETYRKWAQITNNEAQAAIIMFGTDVFTQASQLVSMVPMFIGGFLW